MGATERSSLQTAGRTGHATGGRQELDCTRRQSGHIQPMHVATIGAQASVELELTRLGIGIMGAQEAKRFGTGSKTFLDNWKICSSKADAP